MTTINGNKPYDIINGLYVGQDGEDGREDGIDGRDGEPGLHYTISDKTETVVITGTIIGGNGGNGYNGKGGNGGAGLVIGGSKDASYVRGHEPKTIVISGTIKGGDGGSGNNGGDGGAGLVINGLGTNIDTTGGTLIHGKHGENTEEGKGGVGGKPISSRKSPRMKNYV